MFCTVAAFYSDSHLICLISDIHGNLSDLLSMERVIWRHLPAGANLVFLGDYVDRGKWSFECAVYVLALKALFPHKVTLLRGNHETRELQIKYSFQLECTTKFDDDDGMAIWSLLNQVFDRLPVVAILDDAIYCAHGGIPKSAPTLAEIANQPLDISSPDQDNPVVWETVWSDPLHPSQFLQLCEYTGEESSHKEGFAMNIKRGAAWFFNDEAVNRFFATNGLTHMVRAHEVVSWFYGFCVLHLFSFRFQRMALPFTLIRNAPQSFAGQYSFYDI